MPMFPLGSVLLPGAVLPLHVFEPRYRALVLDCLAAEEHEFGVTLIERGWEVGGGDVRMDVGTVARMIQVAELTDGRYAVVCIGTRRVRVRSWMPDAPYPIADLEDFPDVDVAGAAATDPAEFHRRLCAATARVRRAAALATELGDSCADASAEISDDPLLATYHLAALAPVGPADTYRLLCADGPVQRLDLLDELLDDMEAVLEFRMAGAASDLDIDDPDA